MSWARRAGLALLVVLGLSLAAFAADRTLHQQKVVRGVTMAGVRLGGLERNGVIGALRKVDSRLAAQPLTIKVRDQTFSLPAQKVSLALDVERLADDALQVGRGEGIAAEWLGWMARLWTPRALPIAAKLDDKALLAEMSVWEQNAITDPAFEGAIEVEDGRPVARPPRPGWAIDRDKATVAVTEAYARQARQDVVLELARSEPRMAPTAVEAALAQAKKLLAGDVMLLAELPPEPPAKARDKRRRSRPERRAKKKKDEPVEPRTQRFRFERALMGRALRSRLAEEGTRIDLSFDVDIIDTGLVQARKALQRPAVDARFEIDRKDNVHIVPGRPAAIVDAQQVAAALFEAAQSGPREAPFPIKVGAPPALTTEGARRLNISDLVSQFTTRHPCCRPRVKNIHQIADTIDGTVLRPGEVFSINEFVGQRTVAKGYFPAPTIVEGEMKDTIGGGISQFATTFFNAAFYGGYDIIERQPHSYYFRRYPRGIEATLSFPKPDVIIRNDSASGLLIRTFYSSTSITVKMYGHNDGRKVKRSVSRAVDPTEPPIEYIADPSLDPDDSKTKTRGTPGWSVYVTRVIKFRDGHEKKERRKVTYKPRVRRIRVHPCRIPEGEDGYTGEDCPKKEEDEDEEGDDQEEPDGGEPEPEPSGGDDEPDPH